MVIRKGHDPLPANPASRKPHSCCTLLCRRRRHTLDVDADYRYGNGDCCQRQGRRETRQGEWQQMRKEEEKGGCEACWEVYAE